MYNILTTWQGYNVLNVVFLIVFYCYDNNNDDYYSYSKTMMTTVGDYYYYYYYSFFCSAVDNGMSLSGTPYCQVPKLLLNPRATDTESYKRSRKRLGGLYCNFTS